MVVVATFSDGSTVELQYKPFSTSTIYGGYELDNFSMYVEKNHEMVVTYTFGEVTCTDSTTINVWNEDFTDENTGVKVHVADADYGVTTLNVSPSGNSYVATAVKDFIKDGTLVAYDITLTLDTDGNYALTNGNKTVTLPIPSGVNNPVVYYVSDDGATVTNMNAVKDGNGNVTFTTTHFSTYVIGESTEIEVPENETATGSGSTTTTEKKTVYVLVSTPTAGNQYILVSRGTSGDGYALKENTTTGSSITVNAAGNGISAPYIETTDETIMWNTSSGMTFQSENGGYYLRYDNGLTFSTRSSTNWTVGTNSAYSYSSNRYRYVYNSNGTWTTSSSRNTSSNYNVYFYEKQTVEIETTTTVSGTYKIEGEDISAAVSAGSTAALKSTLTFTPDSGTATTTDVSTTAAYEIVTVDAYGNTVDGDPNDIISTIENGKVTFTGNYGTALVKVSYETEFGTVTDYITIEAKAPYYTINLHKANISYVAADIDAFAEGVTYYTYDSTTETYVEVAADAEFDSTATYYTVSASVGVEITDIITRKNVKAGDTYSVWAVIKEHNAEYPNGKDLNDVDDSRIYWTVSDTSIATIDPHTGVITFTGTNYGTITVTARYLDEDGDILCEDSITISVSATSATVPSDGTNDFPEYPNEGAVRHDKTATAVGNFSETGIAKVELSMTGVPYTTGSEIDVVVMLDMTGSMSDNGMEAAEEATKAFVKTIVVNEDGTYNDNRVAVYAFNSGDSSPYELVALTTIKSDTALETANTAIDTASDKQASGGTPFNEAAEKCYNVLQEAKTTNLPEGVTAETYDRQQFCVFMSDGGPTDYYADDGDGTYTYVYGGNSSGTTNITTYLSGYSSSTSSDWSFTLPTEYYTNLMKADDVTVYTVGLLLQTAPENPSPYSSMTDSTYDSTTDSLTTIGSHYYFTSAILKQMASDESKYIDIFNVDNADKATAAFESIAKDILAAATDVTVADKIGSDYTMVFDAPNAVVDAADGSQEYYIEVIDYELEPVYADDGETITDYTRGTATSLLKLYFGYNESTGYFAATDASGTKAATPVFEKVALGDKGTKFYWTTDSSLADADAISVVGADSVTYYFYSAGMSNTAEDFDSTKWYNMTSGAYASGTNTTVTLTDDDGNVTTSATCQNMIIASPYFVYDAESKMLIWTIEEISSSEMTLTYFLYLNNSGGFSGTDEEIDPATYTTNQFAYVNYTNFNKKECQLEFPVPQMTWNGAQVSYVFYLVNAAGQPVNRAGRVVPFSEAVYVTDVYTYAIIWNDLEQSAGLDAERLAADLVPEVYELYDNDAAYSIHVYEDTNKSNLNNHFVISGSVTDADYSVAKGYTNAKTTYVFNTKADANKYNIAGAYVADDGDNTENESGLTYWCKDYSVTGTFDTVENTDELYGTYYTYTVTSATYTGNGNRVPASSMQSTTGGTIIDGYVYYVDGEGKIYTIVQKTDGNEVEAGFDFHNTTVAFAVVWKPELVEDVVVIDYGLDVVIDVIANDGMAAGVTGVMMDAPSNVTSEGTYETSVGTASISSTDGLWTASKENLTSVRFHMNEMGINAPVTFYYEAGVNYYPANSTTLKSTNMYSSVTVIPATTVYYEDSFVSFSENWTVGTASSKTQDVDRPGENKLNAAYDADNVYGYDSAYETVATYSMGSAAMVHVDANSYATATFSFYGTGFDVIGMTSNDTGVLAVKVVKEGETKATTTKIVDTYYGYAYGDVTKVYTYTWLDATTDADGNTVLEGTYSWVLTSSAATTDSDKATEIPANPVVNDTYTVIEEDWYPVDAETDTDNNLYQVPVIKVDGLDYAKYTVTITATYMKAFDHTTEDGYDLYLDAIRIYDPTGVASNSVANDEVSNAYQADGEGWPSYMELRDRLLTANDFEADLDTTVLTGAMFIDGIDTLGDARIADYTSYGPNNEVYLAPGQGVAFALSNADHLHVGMRRMTGTATYTIESYDEEGNLIKSVTGDVTSATDMYYDITDLKDGTIVIRNSGASGELMLTNLKYTFESNPATAQVAMFMTMRRSAAVLGALNSVDTDSDKTDDTVTGETETDDTVVEDTNNTDNNNTVVEDTNNTENNDPVVEDTNTENDDTIVEDTDTNAPAEDVPEEEIPEEDSSAEDETTGEAPAEQLGFWARLWNAIKNAFNRLFSWFGF